MPITTDYNIFAESFHNTLGKPVKKQMPVPRLPFDLISRIIQEATKTKQQEDILNAWKQSISQVNTTIEGYVEEVLEFNDYDDDNWDDYVKSCQSDYVMGSAYGSLFEVEPNYIEMDDRENVW